VTPDDRRPFGQQRYQQGPRHRDDENKGTPVKMSERREHPADPVKEGDVGQQGDEVDKQVGGATSRQAYQSSQG
jgi:hypothetical protein